MFVSWRLHRFLASNPKGIRQSAYKKFNVFRSSAVKMGTLLLKNLLKVQLICAWSGSARIVKIL
jgi:hypothetical protein